MTRAEILEEVKRIICGDRNTQYGEPEDNFRVIADLWAVYLRTRSVKVDFLTARDVSAMMILFKVGRIGTSPSPSDDTFIDIAGYAACGAECVDEPITN